MAGKILIVEDDTITRRNLSVLLSDEGYDVDQAGDGVQALEIIAEQPFDLVLSDIVMPRMDGLKLLQELQFVAPQMPVMIMTSYVSDTLSSVPAGAAEFIRKPPVCKSKPVGAARTGSFNLAARLLASPVSHKSTMVQDYKSEAGQRL
jgi:DNA-binding NtrC family response regulator